MLLETLKTLGYTPKREFQSVEEFEEFLKKEMVLILDGTEQRIQRPQESEAQKLSYSGKKKNIQ